MFDRFHISELPKTLNVNVTEKRAPTDESVRLLREMEKAAQDKVLAAIRVDNCLMDCVVHAQENIMNAQMDYRVLVKVNGKRLDVRESFDLGSTAEQIAEKMVEALARQIAVELLARPFMTTLKGMPILKR